jgi:ketosteroid isomerase-like protein
LVFESNVKPHSHDIEPQPRFVWGQHYTSKGSVVGLAKGATMSSDNTTMIDRIYEAFETRNFLTFFNLLSPTIHITQCPEVPWGGVFHGLEEAKVFFGKVNTYLEDHVAIERVIDGSDRIAVIGRGHGTIKSTGRGFDVPIMHLWGFQDGLAVRLEIVLDVPAMQAALAP